MKIPKFKLVHFRILLSHSFRTSVIMLGVEEDMPVQFTSLFYITHLIYKGYETLVQSPNGSNRPLLQ